MLDFLYFAQDSCAIGVIVCIPILQVLPIRYHTDGFAGWAIKFGFVLWGRKPLAFNVGLYPKVGEEEKEEDAVHPDKVDPKRNLVVTLLHEIVLTDVDGDQDKLGLQNNEEQIVIIEKL